MSDTHAGMNATMELRTRAASAAVLIAATILAVLGGRFAFAILVALFAMVSSVEWNRVVNGGRSGLEVLPAVITIIAVVALVFDATRFIWAFAIVCAGALVTGASALGTKRSFFWHALGVIYIGIPALALSAMRQNPGDGGYIIGGIFVAVWSADSAALFTGRFFGGPLLAPSLSPKKTWSGLIGSVIVAAVAEALYVAIIGGDPIRGAFFGLFVGIVGNAGDLFESLVKRVFQTKNSGNLIPGHGGMLDRVDSLLFAAPASMAFLYYFGSSTVFGVSP